MNIAFKEIKKLYKECEDDNEIVNYKDHVFYAGYLKYLIQYLESINAKNKDIIKIIKTKE